MPTPDYTFLDTEFCAGQAKLLCASYQQLTDKPLLSGIFDSTSIITALFNAPFALVSHGTEEDPVFNFANRTALDLFELQWSQFTRMPSRMSAESINREERQRLLDRVTSYGYIDDYKGIRISSTGRKFLIENAVVWNLVDDFGSYHGQAAAFSKWSYMPDI